MAQFVARPCLFVAIPGPGTSACHGCSQKKRRKEKKTPNLPSYHSAPGRIKLLVTESRPISTGCLPHANRVMVLGRKQRNSWGSFWKSKCTWTQHCKSSILQIFFFFNVHKQGGKAGAKGLALLSLEILPSAPLLLLLATAWSKGIFAPTLVNEPEYRVGPQGS